MTSRFATPPEIEEDIHVIHLPSDVVIRSPLSFVLHLNRTIPKSSFKCCRLPPSTVFLPHSLRLVCGFFFGFFFLFIYVILIKISGLSFISHWHDRRTRCLYLIQQRPKTSLQDLACISTSSSFCPHSHGNFFSFSYLMSYSPLTTQFKTLKPLSSPTDIANDPLLVFDTATIACIWCSNFYAACIWYSILGLLVTLPRWTLCLQRCQFAFTLPYLKSFLFGVLWNPSIRMWISRVNLVFDFSHITQVSFYEFVIDVTILYRNLPILSF
jgi:hypothetical protein